MDGVLFSTLIVVFREALEAGLIVGIILTALARLNASRYFSHVIVSVLLALGASFSIGGWISSLADSAQEKAGQIIEGGVSLAACGVLTYMFFWMEKQARRLKSDLEEKIEAALSAGDYLAMVSLPFFAVFREGAETVLFLKSVSIQSGGSVSWSGGLLGLGAAVVISVLIFAGGKRVPLRPLFRWTGLFILLMAAGLLAYGIHEWEEAGWVNPMIYPVYDINSFLNEKKGIGSFLKSLFGYNGNPSMTELTAYWVYWSVIFFILRGNKRRVHV